ncbi:FHA domain-containing protein [Variovorax robiniae]|uniref:FHA domain-containing protein n=1 Tax=Variovorax robiniae TaxID=1836199 RepID=A0ABU8X6D3_9BURK
MPKLIMRDAQSETREVLLKPHANVLGRDATNDVVIDSSSASRKHARITVEPAFVTIEDLGSSNGTFVNGVRIDRQVLAHGDEVRIGTFEIRFETEDQQYTVIHAERLPTVPGMLVDLDRDMPTVRETPTSRRGKL